MSLLKTLRKGLANLVGAPPPVRRPLPPAHRPQPLSASQVFVPAKGGAESGDAEVWRWWAIYAEDRPGATWDDFLTGLRLEARGLAQDVARQQAEFDRVRKFSRYTP